MHELIDRLGAEYFGISPEALESDIEYERHSTSEGAVIPLNIDDSGRLYHIFSGPKGEQRYYLELRDLTSLTKGMILAEAFATIDAANVLNDFAYTQLKYAIYEERKCGGELAGVDCEVLSEFAVRLVNALAVEDLPSMIREYEIMLIGLGEIALPAITEFLAAEKKDWRKEQQEGSLYPVLQNYEAAKRVIKK